MIHLFSLCSPGRPSHLVVLNYFGQNISQVCSFEVPPWIVCAILDSLSSNDLLAFLEKSESVLKAHLTSLKGYLFVWLAPLLLFIPCHPLCDFSVNFSLSYSLSLLTFPCCPPFSLLSPNPPCFRLLIVSLPLCPLFSSHPANFPPLSLPASSLLICSGPAGPQRGPEHLRAAQAHQQQSANDRSRRHQLPDVHLRRPGAGAQGPGQRAALRWHVSQLAAQCLRHVCMPSVLWRIMYSASLFSGFVTESLCLRLHVPKLSSIRLDESGKTDASHHFTLAYLIHLHWCRLRMMIMLYIFTHLYAFTVNSLYAPVGMQMAVACCLCLTPDMFIYTLHRP